MLHITHSDSKMADAKMCSDPCSSVCYQSDPSSDVNTLRTGDEDLRFYITTVQDG